MSTLKVNNIKDANGGTSNLKIDGAAKVWFNFNGTGTVAIRDSLNVSSITDNSTGNYTVNFTTSIANANYAALVHGNFHRQTGSAGRLFAATRGHNTGNFQMQLYGDGGNLLDSEDVEGCVFGD